MKRSYMGNMRFIVAQSILTTMKQELGTLFQ